MEVYNGIDNRGDGGVVGRDSRILFRIKRYDLESKQKFQLIY